ncbi:hypothetical protein DI487_07905 [Flavobacterium sediminis]|uniref:T9SS sorting signal type C domain-containing protein n=1 Tax=Flavobacterium sediminis TaxID=2201181 RepID=A0A2U8QV94_9FLAO|nr:hypothetical protein [Flavobacterium sediminis]AWM13794.1 hypothetical protein DI487_07905 [Flavobacterium sediminis]
MKKTQLLVLLGLWSIVANSQNIIFEDNASNYSGSWTNGSNSGTGFTAWDLWTQNTDASNFAGHFLASSVSNGFGDIDTSGSSFGMYGNPSGLNVQANAQRFLNNTGSPAVSGREYLLPGQSFSIDLAIAYRNGYKGIDLMDQNYTILYNFNVGNDLYSTTDSSDLGWAYDQNSVFKLTVHQFDTNTYEVVITRGTDTYSSGSRTGQFSGFKLYVGNTTDGNALNNLYFNTLKVEECAMVTTWDGSTWDRGIPSAKKQVVFSGNYAATSDLTACSVQVTNNATVTVNSGITITTENEVLVDSGADFIFENDAALLQNNELAVNTGNVTYKRDSSPMRIYEYTYWGSPVSGQVLHTFSPLTLSDKFFSFNSTINNWVGENQNNIMTPGKGYAIRAPQGYNSTPQTFNGEFIGTANNGDYTFSLVDHSIAGAYNFVGNPYPSAISVASLIDNSTVGTLYFWTHNTAINGGQFTSDDYAARTKFIGTAAASGGTAPGAYVSAGQGFFVSSNASTTLTFTNAMRVSGNNSQFYRNVSSCADPSLYFYWLNLTNTGGAFKQIAVGYLECATNGYDNGLDGIHSAGQYISFYSIIPSYNLAIQSRAYPWDINDSIPLGYVSNITGNTTFQIEFDHGDTFFDDKDIFLEDTETNTYHNLKTGPYSFNTNEGTYNNRFILHYLNNALGTPSFNSENSVMLLNHSDSLEIYSQDSSIQEILVFDVSGRTILQENTIHSGRYNLPKNVAQEQVIFIKVTLENGVIVNKKYIF